MMLFTSSKQALGSLYTVNCLILTIIAYRFSQTICMKNLCTRRLNYNMLIVNQCGTGYFPSLSRATLLAQSKGIPFQTCIFCFFFFFSFELTAVLALGNAILLTQVFLYTSIVPRYFGSHACISLPEAVMDTFL